MNRPEMRSEPRVPVTCTGRLTLGETSVPCEIQNMCSRGFLIRANKFLPVGQHVHLWCELYPGEAVECVVQVRHVNRECLGARITEITEEHQRLCRRFLAEQSALRLASAA